ncbi:MAG TPA: rhamnan synthesis F family protein [Pseudorhizobium sp.]|jgi:glycosyltransferase involved in cell wall biosynthesis|nr:rhamnan synthesis F family protein [Pseudorhizobium sp.]
MITRETLEVVRVGEAWPKTSVVIPLYNYAGMIEETLEAVKAQDLPDLGLVIVNDKSTDDSLGVARRWALANADRFSTVRVLSNIENGGLSITRNTGISACESELLFFLDADNLIVPSCLRKLVEALDKSDAAFAYSPLESFGSLQSVGGTRVFDPTALAQFPYIDAMALIRRSALLQYDGYFELRYGWEDYDFWLKLAENGEFGIQVPELLGRYRVHRSSMTNTNTSINLNEAIRLLTARHPWIRVPPAPQPGSISRIDQWARYRRYGRLGLKLAAQHATSPQKARRLASRLREAYRLKGARGIARILRESESLYATAEIRSAPEMILPTRTTVSENDRAIIVPAGIPLEPQESRPPLAVVIHIFYPDLAQDIRSYVQNITLPANIFITTCSQDSKQHIEMVFADWERGSVEVAVTTNRGRDIAPKLIAFPHAYEQHEFMLHLHTKKSLHEADLLAQWREHIFQHLVGSPAVVESIVALFEADPALGMVSPQHFEPVRPWLMWAGNREIALGLLDRLRMASDPTGVMDFPAGSMFWMRTAALRPLVDARLTFEDFPEEAGQTDGTLAHAIERMFFQICEAAGFNWTKITLPKYNTAGSPSEQIASRSELLRFVSNPVRGSLPSHSGMQRPETVILSTDPSSTA